MPMVVYGGDGGDGDDDGGGDGTDDGDYPRVAAVADLPPMIQGVLWE